MNEQSHPRPASATGGVHSNRDKAQARPADKDESLTPVPVCQLCGGRLIEIRAKLQCERCHTIWETCCEGGRQ